MVLCKALLVSHVSSIVAELSAESGLRKEMVSVLAKFKNYACFDAAFNKTEAEGGDVGAEDGEGPGDPYDVFSKTLSKMPATMLSFLFDIFSGLYDSDLEHLCKSHSGPLGMIRWSELDGKAGKTWRDLSRQFGLHK